MRLKAVLASSSLIILLSFGIFGCSSGGGGTPAASAEDPAPVPGPEISAEFSADPTTGNAPHDVQFTDESDVEGPGVSYLWVFGDGGTSTLQSPVHTYQLPGTYTVSLLITTSDAVDTQTKADFIEVLPAGPAPEPEFSADSTTGDVQFAVQFTNESELNGAPVVVYLWEFGDGTTSAEVSPRHVYVETGVYTVTLSVTTAGGTVAVSKPDFILVQDPVPPPTADFTFNPKTGVAPLTVSFTNLSDLNGAESADYFWDFGDGDTSTLKDPVHIYTAGGRYSVFLFVSTRGGSDFDFRFEAVTVTFPTEPLDATDYIVTFEQGLNERPPIVLSLLISADRTTSGEVSIPGLGFSVEFDVVPGVVTSVSIPLDAIILGSDVTTPLGIRISATEAVSVYGLHREAFSTDVFTGIPVAALGTEYYVMSMNSLAASLPSQFAIVAIDDDTTITVTPTMTTGARAAGVPYEVTINRMDVYQLQADDTGEDLTGTHIVADKPVAVFSGTACADVPINGVLFCDHLIEQMPPVNTWGTEFITVPLESRSNGDTFRVVAASDETTIMIDGSASETFVINGGGFEQRILEGVNRISADKPILVAQFANGGDHDGALGDPFMMLIMPAERFLNAYTFATSDSSFTLNFVNIVAPSTEADAGQVLLDGVAVSSSLFQPVSGTGFSAAQVPVSLGSHTLSAPSPIGVYAYGFGDDVSYGFRGGMAF